MIAEGAITDTRHATSTRPGPFKLSQSPAVGAAAAGPTIRPGPVPQCRVSQATGGGTDRFVASTTHRARTHGPTGPGPGLHLRLTRIRELIGRGGRARTAANSGRARQVQRSVTDLDLACVSGTVGRARAA
jgi:hypothetical protein